MNTIKSVRWLIAMLFALSVLCLSGCLTDSDDDDDGDTTPVDQGTPVTALTISAGANGNATLGSSIDLDSGVAYLSADAAAAEADLDLCYSTAGATSEDKIFSPNHAKVSGYNYAKAWVAPPTTSFFKTTLDMTGFDAVATTEEIDSIWTAGAAGAVSTSLTVAQGDVVIVKTTAGVNALVLINAQVAGAAGSIDIKVAK